jgi:twinkle protein
VVVTEGEFDAMAVYQATGLPAISLPNGCSSLPPQLLPMMERFKKIILWMDDDAPGQAGAESFTQKLGAGRCHIVRSRQGKADGPKDANDALRAGKNLLEIIQQATPIPHSQIATFDELRQDVYRELLEPGKMRGTPSQSLPTLNKLLKGHRRGEVTVLTGPTGTGKTTLLSQLSLDWCKQGVRTLWGSFEIKNARLAKTMLTQFAQKNLESNLEEYELWADRFAELPMYFLRFYGSSEVEQIVDAMEYAVYVHDVEHVVLDNLQFMLSGQARGIDKFDAQEHAIEVFRAFATRKNVHVTLVIHPRKELDGAQLGVNSIFGTAKATQEADNVLIVQDGGSCRVLEVKKNRFDGDVGSYSIQYLQCQNAVF